MGATHDAVIAEIGRMNEAQLRAVLGNIRGGAQMTGREFIKRFSGLIPPDELDLMDAAIERDCETVEPVHGD